MVVERQRVHGTQAVPAFQKLGARVQAQARLRRASRVTSRAFRHQQGLHVAREIHAARGGRWQLGRE